MVHKKHIGMPVCSFEQLSFRSVQVWRDLIKPCTEKAGLTHIPVTHTRLNLFLGRGKTLEQPISHRGGIQARETLLGI